MRVLNLLRKVSLPFSGFEMTHDLHVFADGSCLKGGSGGWAFMAVHGNAILHRQSGGTKNTTNQFMELSAARHSLCWLADFLDDHKEFDHVILFSDSKYVINGVTEWSKTWIENGFKTARGNPVEHTDQWKSLLYHNHPSYEWRWIKGHSGNTFHDQVDQLARSEAMNVQKNR
jgi:ribonuclease HI